MTNQLDPEKRRSPSQPLGEFKIFTRRFKTAARAIVRHDDALRIQQQSTLNDESRISKSPAESPYRAFLPTDDQLPIVIETRISMHGIPGKNSPAMADRGWLIVSPPISLRSTD